MSITWFFVLSRHILEYVKTESIIFPLFLSTLLNIKHKKKSSEKELRHFAFYRIGTIIFTVLARNFYCLHNIFWYAAKMLQNYKRIRVICVIKIGSLHFNSKARYESATKSTQWRIRKPFCKSVFYSENQWTYLCIFSWTVNLKNWNQCNMSEPRVTEFVCRLENDWFIVYIWRLHQLVSALLRIGSTGLRTGSIGRLRISHGRL